jgi:hypothetical protein
VLASVALAAAVAAVVLILLQRRHVTDLHDDVERLQQRVESAIDGYGDLRAQIASTQTELGNLPDLSNDIDDINEVLNGTLSDVEQLRACGNRNLQEYIASRKENRGGNFEVC